jgi:hypothetical protein
MGTVYVSLSFLLSLCPDTSFELLVAHTHRMRADIKTYFLKLHLKPDHRILFLQPWSPNPPRHTHLSIVLLLILIIEWTVDTFKISFSIRSLPHDHDSGLVTTSVVIQCTVVTPHLPSFFLPLYSGPSTFKR